MTLLGNGGRGVDHERGVCPVVVERYVERDSASVLARHLNHAVNGREVGPLEFDVLGCPIGHESRVAADCPLAQMEYRLSFGANESKQRHGSRCKPIGINSRQRQYRRDSTDADVPVPDLRIRALAHSSDPKIETHRLDMIKEHVADRGLAKRKLLIVRLR